MANDHISDVSITTENASLTFDSALMVTTSASSRVTSHPVESGADISDHVVKENIKITIKGVVTALAHKISQKDSAGNLVTETRNVNGFDIQFTRGLTTSITPSQARETIMEIREAVDKLATVVTPTAIYENMVITNITEPRDVSHGGALGGATASWEVSVDLEQLRIISSGTTQIPVASSKADKSEETDSKARSGQADRSTIQQTADSIFGR